MIPLEQLGEFGDMNEVRMRAGHCLIRGEGLDVLAGIEAGFDCLITDPQGYLLIDEILPALEAAALLCKPKAHAYIAVDFHDFETMFQFFSSLGWEPLLIPFYWNATTGPMFGDVRQTVELFLHATRGGKRAQYVTPNIVRATPDGGNDLAKEKPIALYRSLLSRSCMPGDRVLDPFCRVGSIFAAAERLGLKATGIEADPRRFAIAGERLMDMKK